MKDLLLDSDGNFKFKRNDLVIGDSDNQNITDILQSVKGDYKRSPQTGLNAIRFNNGTTGITDIKNQAKLQLELDGFKVKQIIVTTDLEGQLNIEPYAER